jgi:hypothetical protein
MVAATLPGVVLVEPHLPPPLIVVSMRLGGSERSSQGFTDAAEARAHGLEIARRRGLLFVDLTSASADG